MQEKKRNNSSTKPITKIITVVGILLLGVSIFIFKDEISNIMLKNKSYTPKDVLVSKESLMKDVKIMMAKDGVQGQVLLRKNEDYNKFFDMSFIDKNGKLKGGNIIHLGGLNNRIFTDSKKPVEVRFLIRIMLYLRERKTDVEVGNIVGISGGFNRNANELFEGSQLIKMSVEEFEELYKEANVSELTIERQIDTLTDLWINKTGYWRRGLFGEEEKR